MPLYKITGIGKETDRNRVRVYEAGTQDEAFEKAYKDGTIIDVAATVIIPYPPASEYQLNYAKSLGINYPDGITEKELNALIEETKRWASPNQLRLAKDLGLKLPQKKLTRNQMSDILDEALQDCTIRKRYEKLPPTEAQLTLAKEKGIEIPWRATRQKLSALLDEAIEKEREEKTKSDIEAYKNRIAQDDGTVRGRYIHGNAALEAIKGLLGSIIELPEVETSTRIFKGDKRGSINIIGDSQSSKKARDFYAKLLKENGFMVTKDSSCFDFSEEDKKSYILNFKSEKNSP